VIYRCVLKQQDFKDDRRYEIQRDEAVVVATVWEYCKRKPRNSTRKIEVTADPDLYCDLRKIAGNGVDGTFLIKRCAAFALLADLYGKATAWKFFDRVASELPFPEWTLNEVEVFGMLLAARQAQLGPKPPLLELW
jgi:hypothetical protein